MQICIRAMLSEPRKKCWPQEKTDCILRVLLKLTVLENVFGKTKSRIQVLTLSRQNGLGQLEMYFCWTFSNISSDIFPLLFAD